MHVHAHLHCTGTIADSRSEYRSGIFFHTPEQEAIAKEVTAEVQDK